MMEETLIKFGTDGWRGLIAEDYTFANVRRCAQGFAAYLLTKGWAGEAIVVGHDKRFGAEQFAAAAAEPARHQNAVHLAQIMFETAFN